MDLYGIGFSNIRFAGDDTNYIHQYNYRGNTFSEEVFVHEFLHTLERISKEYGYDTVDLHTYENYGYDAQGMTGLKSWYQAYMRCEILDEKTNTYIGLNDAVFSLKPVHENNFRFAIEVEFNDEPSNMIEEVRHLVKVVTDEI